MGLTTVVCVGLVYAASSNWNPGPLPAGATPQTGNVKPPVYSGQTCPSGQMVTGFDASGSVVCGAATSTNYGWTCGIFQAAGILLSSDDPLVHFFVTGGYDCDGNVVQGIALADISKAVSARSFNTLKPYAVSSFCPSGYGPVKITGVIDAGAGAQSVDTSDADAASGNAGFVLLTSQSVVAHFVCQMHALDQYTINSQP